MPMINNYKNLHHLCIYMLRMKLETLYLGAIVSLIKHICGRAEMG